MKVPYDVKLVVSIPLFADPAVHSIEGYDELMDVCQPGAIENKVSVIVSQLVVPNEHTCYISDCRDENVPDQTGRER